MKMADIHVRRCWCTDHSPDARCLSASTDVSYLWFKEAKKAHAEAQTLQSWKEEAITTLFQAGKIAGAMEKELTTLRRVQFLAEQWRLQRYDKDAPGSGERAFILRLHDAEEDLADELIMLKEQPHE